MIGKLGALMDDPARGPRLKQKVGEAERALAEAKLQMDRISSSIHEETARFQEASNADFAKGLREHIEAQIQFEEEQQAQWRSLRAVFEKVRLSPADV